mgnify:CR=1 FL=1
MGETHDRQATAAGTALAFPCSSCGGALRFAPGSDDLACASCGAHQPIVRVAGEIVACDYARVAAEGETGAPGDEVRVVNCPGCGAALSLPAEVAAAACAFCATPLVLSEAQTRRRIAPQALLPFALDATTAQARFRAWLGGLWFAPNALQKVARQEESLQGLYLPYWAYDSASDSEYVGERGEHRREEYTDSAGRRQTRVVTDWFPASGQLSLDFRDVLAAGSRSLPADLAEALEPWDLAHLQTWQAEYLSGFAAEAYRIDVKEGYQQAEQRMREAVASAVRQQIGGDEQRIHDVRTRFSETRFKHLLLPLWISSYRFDGKLYRFLVNARTGEVQGERPWSAWKIAGAVLAALIVIIWFMLQQ